jgi:hypothetical protein
MHARCSSESRNNEFSEYLKIFFLGNRNNQDKFNTNDQKKKNNRVARHFNT